MNRQKTFRIKKGRHNCFPKILRFPRRIEFEIYVGYSWITEDSTGWNKLIGITDHINHHRHSNRIVWRCVGGKIVFGQYCYLHGTQVTKEFAGTHNPGRCVSGAVEVSDRYYAEMAGQTLEMNRTGKCSLWMLHPYFGGRDVAPQNMTFIFKF